MTEVKQGQKSFVAGWEEKVGVKSDNPNFQILVEDALANEPEEKAQAVRYMLGFIELPRKRIPLKEDEEPSWMKYTD